MKSRFTVFILVGEIRISTFDQQSDYILVAFRNRLE
jgi:hypothetical protein